jgi:hypothetical protein
MSFESKPWGNKMGTKGRGKPAKKKNLSGGRNISEKKKKKEEERECH